MKATEIKKAIEQGYKVLDPHIGAIYGDSITLDRANEICKRLEAKGFASTNIVFQRSATAPSTPSASAGVPSGWYDSASGAAGRRCF